jgi:hypothetical protein
MADVKELVNAIIKFLADQQTIGALDEESLESLDGKVLCYMPCT